MNAKHLLPFICVILIRQVIGLRQQLDALQADERLQPDAQILQPGDQFQEEDPLLQDQLREEYNEKHKDDGLWLPEDEADQGNEQLGRRPTFVFSGSGSGGFTLCIGGSQGSRCADSCRQRLGTGYTGGCVYGRCRCTNNPKDIECGMDGSIIGIRCPDVSACRRKCCRDGRTGGRCRGFLKLSCKCD